MTTPVAILLVMFVTLVLLNVPIAFVMVIATVAAVWASAGPAPAMTVVSDMMSGVESFTLLAIPFFILAGELMTAGGLARRLIDLAYALVGRIRGGLGPVNTLTCMLFGSISGSATAAVSSIGGMLIPEMERKGYPRDFSTALTVSSATTGLLIPPSNAMIVYAVAAGNVSIASLFLGGVMPGVLMGMLLMMVALVISRAARHGTVVMDADGVNEGKNAMAAISVPRALMRAMPALLLVIFVLGGILGGVFTPTEASAMAVVWALFLGVVLYREIPLRQLPLILRRSARTTAVVLLLVAASQALSVYLTSQQVPVILSETMLALHDNPIVILLVINVLLLVVGVFMDMTPAILIFTPILLPVIKNLGLDPVHFGVILVTNLCIGLCTPPVGTCLFVGCSIARTDVARITRALLPFYAVMVLALMIITYWSPLTMWLPGLSDR